MWWMDCGVLTFKGKNNIINCTKKKAQKCLLI